MDKTNSKIFDGSLLKLLSDGKYDWEKLTRELDAKVIELYALYNISKVINLSFAIDEVFDGTIEIIDRTLNVDEFCIMLLDETTWELVVRAWYPAPPELPRVSFKLGEGVSGAVAITGVPVLIQDVSKEPGFLFYKGAKKDIGAFLCVPLTGRHGDILGVFNIHKSLPNSLTEKDAVFFSEIAKQIAAAIEKSLIYNRTKEASLKDDLTGLYNRRYFSEYVEIELARARRYNNCFSIVIIDIDHFKNFNDRNGHSRGDNALKQVAKKLIENLRASDVVVRYGGEEFLCFFPETSREQAFAAAEKLRKSVEEYNIEGGENQPDGRLTITLGVATWPGDAVSAGELIDSADRALYKGKSEGRNRVCCLGQ